MLYFYTCAETLSESMAIFPGLLFHVSGCILYNVYSAELLQKKKDNLFYDTKKYM